MPPPVPPGTLYPFQGTELYFLSRIASRLDDIVWLLLFIAAMTAASAWLLFTRL